MGGCTGGAEVGAGVGGEMGEGRVRRRACLRPLLPAHRHRPCRPAHGTGGRRRPRRHLHGAGRPRLSLRRCPCVAGPCRLLRALRLRDTAAAASAGGRRRGFAKRGRRRGGRLDPPCGYPSAGTPRAALLPGASPQRLTGPPGAHAADSLRGIRSPPPEIAAAQGRGDGRPRCRHGRPCESAPATGRSAPIPSSPSNRPDLHDPAQ